MFDRDEWMRRLGPLYPAVVAIRCVTRLPVAPGLIPAGDDLQRAAKWFTVAAGLVGLALAALAAALSGLDFAPAVVAAVVAIAAVVATRGLYEGGLARTLDAARSAPAPEDSDAPVGAAGAAAIAAVLGLRAVGLMTVEARAWAWLGALIVSQMLARFAVLLLARIGDHLEHPVPARAPLLVGDCSWPSLAFAGAVAAVFAIVFAGGLGVAMAIAVPGLAVAIGLWIQRRFGGFTSDSLAAVSATCEIAALLLYTAAHPAVASPFMG